MKKKKKTLYGNAKENILPSIYLARVPAAAATARSHRILLPHLARFVNSWFNQLLYSDRF